MRNVLYVPDLNVNLLSYDCMVSQGISLQFFTGQCRIYNSEYALLATATGYGTDVHKLDVEEAPILVYDDFWNETNIASF